MARESVFERSHARGYFTSPPYCGRHPEMRIAQKRFGPVTAVIPCDSVKKQSASQFVRYCCRLHLHPDGIDLFVAMPNIYTASSM